MHPQSTSLPNNEQDFRTMTPRLRRKLGIRLTRDPGKTRKYPPGTDAYSRLYRIWKSMKERCLREKHPKYSNYGGKGITVCSEWLKYGPFREWAISSGYTDELSIDRKDNDLGYSPSNCQWKTVTEQNNNKRTNMVIHAWGETKNATAWSKDPRCKVSFGTLYRRILRGMNPEEALTLEPQNQDQFKSHK